jgi:HAD superfamily hydrolase (TIGR01509 family)
MIRAFLFDLDGTLVQTEKMKALAYAMAVQRLRGLDRPDERAIEAYKEIIGSQQDVASKYIMDKLGLANDLISLMQQYRVETSSLVLRRIWTEIYPGMVADPKTLKDNQWPYTVDLLRQASKTCFIGIVTGSPRNAVLHVTHSLGLETNIDIIVSGDDVKRGKPDPESYLLAKDKLEVLSGECLVLEDSVNGVKSAKSAGMNVIAIATPFTDAGLHADQIVEDCQIVHEPDELLETVRHTIEQHSK